jgi:hypothetical protein
MKWLLPPLLALAPLTCSYTPPHAAQQQRSRSYLVTFAAALVPDSLLNEFSGTFSKEKGYRFDTFEQRYGLARHLLDHPDKYPVFQTDGGWDVIVVTGGEARMQIKPHAADAEFSQEKTDVRLDRFEATVAVSGETPSGEIMCSWSCDWMVTSRLGYPGGGRPGGGILFPGKPEMMPLARFGDQSLWMIVELRRK